ncbi:WD repeat-containing protein CG11141 [Eupeodes corollae]|uniref:WD repeat-containing protein CG11141 n=1 Tax=Eupeodes corollae TaxID=290404 RepID=UPI0024923ACD|nr:WD repeat-containing protein CG11141 [Eupeodes corollae]
MERNHEIYSLREWAPLTEIIEKIPHRIQKGLFPVDLGITCIDVVPEFIALGSDAGIVFWYNRFNGEVQKLRSEVSSPITCVKIVSSVEYMVAAGNSSGQVSVFQIQKELPADLDLVAPFTKAKPVERYTIRDLHNCSITCCEWSKNGMKLYSGNKQGVIVLTEFDYQNHLSKSVEILNEAYEIVQLSIHQSYLLVSTLYRSIICQRNSKTNQWQLSQVGKKDRKTLADIGGKIYRKDSASVQLICGRPGLRLWLADVDGNVEKTLLFRDALSKVNAAWEIPILNPCRSVTSSMTNFRSIDIYLNKYVVTHDETMLYILNLEQLKVEAVATGFRRIIDFCISNKEIFVLEGPRSLLRLAPCPEPPSKTAKIIFNPLLPPPVPVLGASLFESPIEYEAEDEAVINAEECFELPPIEEINLDIPIELAVESPRAEQSRRMEILSQIGETEFEESILHHRGVNSNKKEERPKKKKKQKPDGIVEIGQAIAEKTSVEKPEKPKTLEFTAKPTVMDASFCTDPSSSCIPSSSKPYSALPTSIKNFLPEALTPNSLQQAIEVKGKALAEKLQLEPVELSEISEEEIKQSQSELQSQMKSQLHSTTWQYPLKQYPITQLEDAEVQTTPRKKIHFINDDDDDQDECDSVMTLQNHQPAPQQHKHLQFIPTQPIGDIEPNEMMPTVVKMPDSMQIPSLWNISVETIAAGGGRSSPGTASSHTSSEWEFLDN